MPAPRTESEYYIVHRLCGDAAAIKYLKQLSSPSFVEALLYEARHHSQSEFYIHDVKYCIRWTEQRVFEILPAEEEGKSALDE